MQQLLALPLCAGRRVEQQPASRRTGEGNDGASDHLGGQGPREIITVFRAGMIAAVPAAGADAA